jgi:HAD superfamily hydrolase (TIGR01509 family)
VQPDKPLPGSQYQSRVYLTYTSYYANVCEFIVPDRKEKLMSLPKMPQGILFDRGGVLVHGNRPSGLPAPPQRWAQWLATRYDLNAAFWLEAVQPHNVGYDVGRLSPLERLHGAAASYGVTIPDGDVKAIMQVEWQFYANDCRLDPDIAITDEILQMGILIGLCSNASPNEENGDRMRGLQRYITPSGYSHYLGVLKPDPQAYIRAAALLGLEPTDCWFVDDGGDGSLQGAQALGMTAIYYQHPGAIGVKNPALVQGFTGPIIHSLRDLMEMLTAVVT